jgi:1,4-alpha-glucan branching enzyme
MKIREKEEPIMIQKEDKREKKPKSPGRVKKRSQEKTVEFRLNASAAEAVYLAGEFNGWDPYSLPMKKDKDGIWKATTRLRPGRYEYKLMAGRVWVEDLPEAERVMNPFGTQNFVIRVE